MNNEESKLPNHIGFILDGNRRWAKKHSLPEYDGHLAGYNALHDVLDGCYEAGVKYISVYAFSNENWKRDNKEVSGLMKLTLHAISKDLKRLIERRVQVRILGRKDGISEKILAAFEKAEEKTRHLDAGVLAICFNYGGQQEIVDAARKCVQDGLSPEEIDEQAITDRIYYPDVPPLDLIVRTSGEQRLSNFMLWRSAYSEFLFLDKFWPEMTKEDVPAIINEYNRRQRRYGG